MKDEIKEEEESQSVCSPASLPLLPPSQPGSCAPGSIARELERSGSCSRTTQRSPQAARNVRMADHEKNPNRDCMYILRCAGRRKLWNCSSESRVTPPEDSGYLFIERSLGDIRDASGLSQRSRRVAAGETTSRASPARTTPIS